jgi:mono/diheme cytochrome c family protein
LARLLDKSPRFVASVCALAALAFAGCGEREPDLVNGKRLFIGKGTCGSCHAMERAGTAGTQGPDLDKAFAVARKEGFGSTGIEGVTRFQIEHPRRGSIMPANLVKGQDADDVAAYVGEVAGKPGEDTGALASVGTNTNANKTAVAKGGALEIPADPTGALAFTFGKAEAPAGPITITSPNDSPVQHNIALQGGPAGEVVSSGGVSQFKATLKKGEIEFLCTVPGHAEGGMKGTLTVK